MAAEMDKGWHWFTNNIAQPNRPQTSTTLCTKTTNAMTNQTEPEDELVPESLDVTASEGDAFVLYDEADQIAYGEEGNQRRVGREQANFYAGGTTSSNANASQAGNPGGGDYDEGTTNETASRFEGLLSENGMHITENP